jgi:GntR family transcriptional regulator, rspAB operon transcriptional repressor
MARARLNIPGISAVPTPVGRAPARGQIGQETYESIRTAILNCSFPPGMALSELAVSEELGVSKAPVRDAFRRLAGEGLLEVVPQRGTSVSLLSRARIRDAIFVREVIECRAAELAAQAPPAERNKLNQWLDRQVVASDQRDFVGHLTADEAMHHEILVLAGHRHAWGPLLLARTGMNRIRHIAIPELGGNRIAIDQHRKVVRAIVAGDGARAREAMLTHIRSPLDFVDAICARYPEYFSAD